MPRTRAKSGEMKQYDEPEGGPLLRLVGFAGLWRLTGVERPQVDESGAALERCREGRYPVPW
jgi:hypothetical protein